MSRSPRPVVGRSLSPMVLQDFLFARQVADDTGVTHVELLVADAKASNRVKLSHRIQARVCAQ